jgi:hypothetical protein
MACLSISSSAFAQASAEEVAQLKERVAALEKQVAELKAIIEPLKAQQSAQNQNNAVQERRKALREKFEKKMAQDREKYSQPQLRDAERLYQIANQKWGTDEALQSLQTMIKQYPDINRTGCAVLYVAQQSQGEERTNYLKQCIEKHNDCFYGDGVQVGVFARFLLASDYLEKGKRDEANTVFAEIQQNYADSVDHSGKLLIESIPK